MKLKRLQIEAMPGVRGLRLEGISTGLTLVLGPNGSGKTTSCRSIQGLLWPARLDSVTYPEIYSEWEILGEEYQINRVGDEIRYLRAGSITDAPAFPAEHLAPCFMVTIDDLFDARSSELAAEVERDMAGGFDLRILRDADALSFRSRKAENTRKRLAESSAEVSRERHRQAELDQKRALLEELRDSRAEAVSAGERLELLRMAQALLESERALRDAIQHEETLPDALARMNGDELARHKEFSERIALNEEETRSLEKQRSRNLDAMRRSGISDVLAENFSRELLTEDLEILKDRDSSISSLEKEAARLEVNCRDLREKTASLGDEAKLANLALSELERVREFHARYQEFSAELGALQSEFANTRDTRPLESLERDLTTLRTGVAALRRWLKAVAFWEAKRRMLRFAALVSTVCVVCITPLALQWYPNGLLLYLIPLLASFLFLRNMRTSSAEEIRSAQAEYEQLELLPPQSWEEASVIKILRDLEHELDESRFAVSQARRAQQIQAQIADKKRDEVDLERERVSLLDTIGAAPDSSSMALVFLFESLREFQQKHRELEGVRAKIERDADDRSRRLEILNGIFSTFAISKVFSLEEAKAASVVLIERWEMYRGARKNVEEIERRLSGQGKEHEGLSAQLAAFFRKYGLKDEAEHELRSLLQQLPTYKELQSKLDRLSRETVSIREQLSEKAPELLECSAESLSVLHHEATLKNELRDDLTSRISEIETVHRQACEGRSLEIALSKEEEAFSALSDQYRGALRSAAGSVLLEEIESEYAQESRPAVLREAERLFSNFTRARFELLPSDSGSSAPEFRARDSATGRVLSLSELSRGTRIQLLLAARFAFAIRSESSSPLPFILDEVLSSSDPSRFQAIAEALLSLVKDGRQVLYFSCQPEDAERWQQVAREQGISTIASLILPPLGSAASHDRIEPFSGELSQVMRSPIPPESRSYAEYVQALQIPEIDPTAGADAVHIAHLLDDTKTLYSLLCADIVHFGQLRRLRDQGVEEVLLGAKGLEVIEARAAFIEAFSSAAKVGRGKRLTPEVLLQTEKLSDNFQKEVIALAEGVDWDAREFISRLDPDKGAAIRGFRRSKVERMKENLLEGGYLEAESPLAREEVQARVYAEVAPFLEQKSISPKELGGMFNLLWSRL